MATYSPSKITKDGNTYNFRDTTKIPLTGTNALAGSIVPDTDNAYRLGNSNMRYQSISAIQGEFDTINSLNEEMTIFSSNKANPWEHGAYLSLFGEDYTGDSQRVNAFRIGSINSNTSYTYVLLGDSSGNLSWNGQSIQTTSDQRLKQQITEIDDKLLDAWEDVELSQFKYNDAVDQKKDKARLHTGYVVQQIDEACKSHGVDVSEYGLYCHEEYPQETEEVEVKNEDGTKTKETKVIREASEHYSLRYTEALIVECAYLRKCIKELRNEIEQLKSSK